MKNFQEVLGYDLSAIPDYARLPEAITDLTEQYESANQAYQVLGREGLAMTFSETSPEAYVTVAATKTQVRENAGAILLQGVGVEKVDDEVAQLLSITIGSVYGRPTRTDRRLAQIAWPVHYDSDTSVVRTFSQSLGEAAFHTDTQYFVCPEESFGLFCIESDMPGKGTSQLLHVDDVVSLLQDQRKDLELAALTRPFPFRVPSVFTHTGKDSDVEIVWAPIIANDKSTIRYRKDTIANALREPEVEIDDEQQQALAVLEAVLAELIPVEHHLQPGEAIIIDNTRLLHARTSFDDPARFLYRVRMKDDE